MAENHGGRSHRRGEIMRSKILVAVTAAAALLVPAGAYSAAASTSGVSPAASVPPAIPGTSSNFQLVGHNPLYHRGMNAAAAIFGNYLYVGNRSDGSDTCPDGSNGCAHPHPGVLILNISHPAQPDIVGEIGPPFAGNVGITTREVRASAAGVAVKPHEIYLWADPGNPSRALLWISTPAISANPAIPSMMVADISQVPAGGPVREVAEGNWNDLYPGTSQANYPFDPSSPTGCGPYNCNLFVHSMAPAAD